MCDYLDLDALIALGIDHERAERLLADSPLTGHDSRRIVPAENLPDLLAALDREEGRQP